MLTLTPSVFMIILCPCPLKLLLAPTSPLCVCYNPSPPLHTRLLLLCNAGVQRAATPAALHGVHGGVEEPRRLQVLRHPPDNGDWNACAVL
jgi:hypothetical protein